MICLYTNINFSTTALFGGQAKMHAMLFPFLGDRNSDYWQLTTPLLWGGAYGIFSFLFAALMLEEMVKIYESQLTPTPSTRCFNVWINSQHLSVTPNKKVKFGLWNLEQVPEEHCDGVGDPGTGAPGGLGLGWDWNWGGDWDWGGYGVGEGLMADCQQLKSVKAHTYIRYTQINRFDLFCHF